jgi:hypothetical protein
VTGDIMRKVISVLVTAANIAAVTRTEITFLIISPS